MRIGPLAALGVTVVALAGAFALVPGANASSGVSPAVPVSTSSQASAGTPGICYPQPDHDMFNGIISQNFEPSNDIYDAQAADDFVLTKPCRWPVITIDGSRPAVRPTPTCSPA